MKKNKKVCCNPSKKGHKRGNNVNKYKRTDDERISIFFNRDTHFADFGLFEEFIKECKDAGSALRIHRACLCDPALMARRGMKKFAALFMEKYGSPVPDKEERNTLFPDGIVYRTELISMDLLLNAIHTFIRANILVKLNLMNVARAMHPLVSTALNITQFYNLLWKCGDKYDLDRGLDPFKYGSIPRKKYKK